MREVTDGEAGKSVRLAPGEPFALVLPENATTGYRWQLESGGEPVCLLTGETFKPGQAPGAGGVHRWQFEAAQAGTTRIRLTLRRGWQPTARAARTFEFGVSVS